MALSEEGNRIVSSAREAYGPTRSDRARNRRALGLRIALGTSAATSVATGSVLSSAASKVVLIGLTATTAVAGGGLVYEWTSNRAGGGERPSRTHSSVDGGSVPRSVGRPSEPVTQANTADVPSAASNQPSPPAVGANDKPARALPPSASGELKPDVEAELALLREARSALSGSDPGRALELTDAHARAFPRGVLTEERAATRIVALCSLGRHTDGRRETQAFLARSPDSPLAERVRTACSSSERSR
jgi:hypothetical protein